jgi:DNA-binding SARP family transcriptional activator
MLGWFDVTVENASAAPNGAKPRTVLALLALNPGRVVTTETLITELWNSQPPRSARTTLQTYIMHIRKILARAAQVPLSTIAHDMLVTRADGYWLAHRKEDIDAVRFDRLAATGSDTFNQGRYAEASRIWREALGLWSGGALDGVVPGPVLEAEARRLEEARVRALGARIEAELRAGRPEMVLGDLAALVAQHAFNESFHAQYMRALSQTGRRADALQVYHDLRSVLIDELGLEPGSQVREVHQAILVA